jgi:glycosyltransferase involved in cell wall biosynthesis
MRIVQVCTSDTTGGAARAAYRLHHGLNAEGADSTLLVGTRTSADPRVSLAPRDESIVGIVRRQYDKRWTARNITSHAASIARGFELFSSDHAPEPNRASNALPPCDLVHLHWVTWFVDYERFFSRLPPGLPVVWTLHDMNTFTGGCHYDAGCGRYLGKCGMCPALDSAKSDDLSSEIFLHKSKVFSRYLENRLHLVLPSRWLADTVAKAPLLGRFPRSVIPYGIDTNLYRPIDSKACRQVLGIPPDAKVVLFVAEAMENLRKGFSLLVQALAELTNVPGIFLLSIGKRADDSVAGIPHLSLGTVTNDLLLPAVYGAADVMVIPSLQDNLPNTVLEAMACGTPSVGFDIGGIPDMIRPGVTGFLAPARNVPELAMNIRKILSQGDDQTMSRACREIAVAEYSESVQAKRCIDLYRDLVGTAKISTPSIGSVA